MSAETFHVEALIFVIILVIYVLTSHIIENRKIPYLHESSIAIIMGILTAIISKYVRTLLPGPAQTDIIQQRTILRPYTTAHHLLGRLQPQKIPVLLKLRHDQLPGNIRDHHRLLPALPLPHLPQSLLPNPHPHRNPHPRQRSMRHRYSRRQFSHSGRKVPRAQCCPIRRGHSQRRGGYYFVWNHQQVRTRLNWRIIHVFFCLGSYKVVEQMALNFCYLFFFSVAFGTLSGFGLSYLFKMYESINKHPIK